MDFTDWLRQFRKAKTIATLDIMARRKTDKHPEQAAVIRRAHRHREEEIIAARYQDAPC